MRSFAPRPMGRADCTVRSFPLATKERRHFTVRSFPLAIGRERFARCGLFPSPYGERGLHGAVFSPRPMGRADCTVRSFPLAPVKRRHCTVQSFLPLPYGERAGVRGNRQYPAVKSSTERGSEAPYSAPSGPTIMLWVLPIASFTTTFCPRCSSSFSVSGLKPFSTRSSSGSHW